MVGLTVPGAAEPMPAVLFASIGFEGRDAAQVRPRGFVTDPFGIVADCDQQDRGGINPDTVTRQEFGCGLSDELGEDLIEFVSFPRLGGRVGCGDHAAVAVS